MGYSIDPLATNCYEGTTCLINKLNIHDDKMLSVIEALITSAKCTELEKNPIEGEFDFSHYLSIHRFIFDDFVDFITDFYDKTNMLHPFREGNGRTQRMFLTQLIRFYGYDINFSEIDTDELMIATIHDANGVSDYLKSIFRNSIRPK